MDNTEKVEGEKMRHVEAYHTAAKLSELVNACAFLQCLWVLVFDRMLVILL